MVDTNKTYDLGEAIEILKKVPPAKFDESIDLSMKLTVDPNNAPLTAGKFTILDTRTDNFDYARAKANAEDAMTKNADLACMVGLFAYNIPQCFQAVKEANKLGKIKYGGDPRGYTVNILLPVLDGDSCAPFNTWGGEEEGWGIA